VIYKFDSSQKCTCVNCEPSNVEMLDRPVYLFQIA
jgi:hypothetical protein